MGAASSGPLPWLLEWDGKTLIDLWDGACERHGAAVAAVSGAARLTYAEADRRVSRLAKGLLAAGVRKGDKIALWMPNRPDWLVAEFAVAKCGGVIVPLSTRFKAYELEYILRQSDAVALLMAGRLGKIDFADILRQVCPELPNGRPGETRGTRAPALRLVAVFGSAAPEGCFDSEEVMRLGDGLPDDALREAAAGVTPDDVVNIPYTSGTTGFPKGVMTTHRQYLAQTVCFRERLGLRDGDRFLAVAPFFANFGNYFGVLLPVMTGGCSVMAEAYDPTATLRLLEEERVTHFSGTPTMYLDLLNHPELSRRNLSALRTAMTGAAPAPVQMVRDVYAKMGVEVLCNGYGMTENSGCTTMTRRGDPPEVLAKTAGKPLPGVAVCIKDPGVGARLGPGQVGELCTRGWNVMKGYYRMPEETAACFDDEGWFHTGDLGMLDEDGNFVVTGRLKEMFISGGFNVYPAEVENFLQSFDKVGQAAVVGVPDGRMGEAGAAFIVAKPGATLSEEEVFAYCRAGIAGYKVPKYVTFVSELPVIGVGKVQKYRLRESWDALHGAGSGDGG